MGINFSIAISPQSANLAEIRAQGYHCLVASRQPEHAWLAEFDKEDDWEEVIRTPSPRNPGQKKSRVQIKRRQKGNEVYLLYLHAADRVETAFCAMKSPLMERRIVHHMQDRAQTHIFLCVLAYHLLAAIEKRFLD